MSPRFPLGWLIATGVTALLVGGLIGPAVMKYFKPAAFQTSQSVVRSPVRLEPGYWLEELKRLAPAGK